jgi:hypothetical protein
VRSLLGRQIDGEKAVGGGGFETVCEPLLQGSAGGDAPGVIVDNREADEAAASVDAVVKRTVVTEPSHFDPEIFGLADF